GLGDRLAAAASDEPRRRQPLDRRAVRVGHLAADDLEVDLVLVVEVAIERADGDARGVRDLGRADRVVALGAEQLGRGLDQRLVAAARPLLPKVWVRSRTQHLERRAGARARCHRSNNAFDAGGTPAQNEAYFSF